MPEDKQQFASMSEVVMKKGELLSHLVENKAKHDAVLAAAIEGYWEIAKEKVAQKRKQLQEQITNWQEGVEHELRKIDAKIESKEVLPGHVSLRAVSVDSNLGLVYPQDHSQDYTRAIRMMEASIFDQVELSVDEFDAYVLNNWEWKNNFVTSNSVYVSAMKGKLGPRGRSGSPGMDGISGTLITAYDNANTVAWNQIACSGQAIM